MNTGSGKTTQRKKRGGRGKKRAHVSLHTKRRRRKHGGRRGARIMKTQYTKLSEGQQKALPPAVPESGPREARGGLLSAWQSPGTAFLG